MGRRLWSRWAPVLVALVLTVAVIAALSLWSRAPADTYVQAAQAETPAALWAPASGQEEISLFASFGGFLGILLVSTIGLAVILRPKRPEKPRRRGSRSTGAGREYSRKTRV